MRVAARGLKDETVERYSFPSYLEMRAFWSKVAIVHCLIGVLSKRRDQVAEINNVQWLLLDITTSLYKFC